MPTIIKEILFHRRQYFIDKVQAPLLKAICTLANRYPKPEKERLVWENSRKLVDFFEFIRKNHKNPGRQKLMDAGERIIVDKYEVDGYYAFFLDLFVAWAKENDWQPENRGFPMWRYWSGPLLKDNMQDTNPAELKAHKPDWLSKRMKAKLGQI